MFRKPDRGKSNISEGANVSSRLSMDGDVCTLTLRHVKVFTRLRIAMQHVVRSFHARASCNPCLSRLVASERNVSPRKQLLLEQLTVISPSPRRLPHHAVHRVDPNKPAAQRPPVYRFRPACGAGFHTTLIRKPSRPTPSPVFPALRDCRVQTSGPTLTSISVRPRHRA